jgi:hypothetical protein
MLQRKPRKIGISSCQLQASLRASARELGMLQRIQCMALRSRSLCIFRFSSNIFYNQFLLAF